MAVQENTWLWGNSNKKSDKIVELQILLEELRDENLEIISKLEKMRKVRL